MTAAWEEVIGLASLDASCKVTVTVAWEEIVELGASCTSTVTVGWDEEVGGGVDEEDDEEADEEVD